MIAEGAVTLVRTLRLRGAPDGADLRAAWSRVAGRPMARALAWEGGTQWLLRRLGALGIEDALPAELRTALRGRAAAEQARCLLVDAEAEGLVRYLGERGVPCVLIKGTARRAAASRYPGADARLTVDVDVLLPAEHVQGVWDDLRARGWPFAGSPSRTPAGHYHPPPLQGPHGVGVELHRSTGGAVPAAEAWLRASGGDELEWHGVRVRVPPATELLWHGLTHALVAGASGFRLRCFLDAAAILASGLPLDWERLAARVATGAEVDPRLARAWLRAAADLAGPPPAPVSGDAPEFDVARALAWRLTVLGGRGGDGFRERLLEEGTRTELGIAATPVVEGTGPLRQARRWAAGRVARLAYRGWRAVARERARGRAA
ncbi:MAG TPA: nucleotidyltransferase family protein [Gemmatimonadales bacterium]|nr:nucleotidyltransferase family protein [Gemmatimonadales bacterium]